MFNAFGPGDMTDYFIRFVNDLDPNDGSGVQYWPMYSANTVETLSFSDGDVSLSITVDNERLAGTSELTSISGRFLI